MKPEVEQIIKQAGLTELFNHLPATTKKVEPRNKPLEGDYSQSDKSGGAEGQPPVAHFSRKPTQAENKVIKVEKPAVCAEIAPTGKESLQVEPDDVWDIPIGFDLTPPEHRKLTQAQRKEKLGKHIVDLIHLRKQKRLPVPPKTHQIAPSCVKKEKGHISELFKKGS